MEWHVYVLECADNSLYTGIAKDVQKRLLQHQCGKGAKYTATRLPVKLVWQEVQLTRSDALKREYQIKQLDRKQKEKLIMGQ